MEKSHGAPRKRLVVYTALFGGKGALFTPLSVPDGVDFVCFTDDPALSSEVWNIRQIKPTSSDSVRNAKIYKILAHVHLPQYEYSIWVDGNVVIKDDVLKLLDCLSDNVHLAAYSHSQDIPPVDCIYCEADRLIHAIDQGEYAGLDKAAIENQVVRLQKANYPSHTGLIAEMVLVRKHHELDCVKNMNEWWDEIQNGSSRDELSFNYVAWKNGLHFSYIPGYVCNNQFFLKKR